MKKVARLPGLPSLWGDQRQIWIFGQCSVNVVGGIICAVSGTGWMVSWWLGGQLVRRTWAIRGSAGHRHRTASYEHCLSSRCYRWRHRCDHHRRGSGVAHVPTNPGEYHAIVFSKRGDIAAYVGLSLSELHWRAFVFEAATNKECPANDDQAMAPKQYRERVATHDWRQLDHRRLCSRESSKAQYVT